MPHNAGWTSGNASGRPAAARISGQFDGVRAPWEAFTQGRNGAPETGSGVCRAKLSSMALTRRGILVRASLLAVAVAVLVVFVVWTRQARARVPWERHPERILYCDRTYRRSETWFAMSASEIDSLAIGGSAPLEQVGRIPPLVGQPILARDSVRPEGWSGSWELCTSGLWLEISDDKYTYYGLLGGP